jgi:hypothetical protein
MRVNIPQQTQYTIASRDVRTITQPAPVQNIAPIGDSIYSSIVLSNTPQLIYSSLPKRAQASSPPPAPRTEVRPVVTTIPTAAPRTEVRPLVTTMPTPAPITEVRPVVTTFPNAPITNSPILTSRQVTNPMVLSIGSERPLISSVVTNNPIQQFSSNVVTTGITSQQINTTIPTTSQQINTTLPASSYSVMRTIAAPPTVTSTVTSNLAPTPTPAPTVAPTPAATANSTITSIATPTPSATPTPFVNAMTQSINLSFEAQPVVQSAIAAPPVVQSSTRQISSIQQNYPPIQQQQQQPQPQPTPVPQPVQKLSQTIVSQSTQPQQIIPSLPIQTLPQSTQTNVTPVVSQRTVQDTNREVKIESVRVVQTESMNTSVVINDERKPSLEPQIVERTSESARDKVVPELSLAKAINALIMQTTMNYEPPIQISPRAEVPALEHTVEDIDQQPVRIAPFDERVKETPRQSVSEVEKAQVQQQSNVSNTRSNLKPSSGRKSHQSLKKQEEDIIQESSNTCFDESQLTNAPQRNTSYLGEIVSNPNQDKRQAQNKFLVGVTLKLGQGTKGQAHPPYNPQKRKTPEKRIDPYHDTYGQNKLMDLIEEELIRLGVDWTTPEKILKKISIPKLRETLPPPSPEVQELRDRTVELMKEVASKRLFYFREAMVTPSEFNLRSSMFQYPTHSIDEQSEEEIEDPKHANPLHRSQTVLPTTSEDLE